MIVFDTRRWNYTKENSLGKLEMSHLTDFKGQTEQLQKGFFFSFFKFYFIFKLYNIVLVLPNIEMNPPQVNSRKKKKRTKNRI